METNQTKLTVPEVAQKLGLSNGQVYRRIQSGALEATQGGPRNWQYFVDPADLDAYIAAGQTSRAVDRNIGGILRVSEAARRLGFSAATVRRLCDEGRLDHFRGNGRNGQYRISQASVDDFIAGRH